VQIVDARVLTGHRLSAKVNIDHQRSLYALMGVEVLEVNGAQLSCRLKPRSEEGHGGFDGELGPSGAREDGSAPRGRSAEQSAPGD